MLSPADQQSFQTYKCVRFIAAFLGSGEPAMLRRVSGVNGSGRGDALLFDTDRDVAKAAMNRQHSRTLRAQHRHWD